MSLPPGVEANVGAVAVRLLNLAMIGALFEHTERFSPAETRLTIRWRELRADIAVRLVRTSITARNGSQFVYQTGAHFIEIDARSEGVIAAIVRAGTPAPAAAAAENAPLPDEDTWTRTINYRPNDSEDGLRYMRFRMNASGWTKEYVADAVQPFDGFTIPRSENMDDALVLQRVFESADDTGRRKMQTGIEAKIRRLD